jgi:protein dithiol oxidoreductase (disulfide-forming)
MFKRLIAVLILLTGLPLAACAQDNTPTSQPPAYQAGKDYELLEQPLLHPYKDQVEVIEFFWYGCPHCYHFEPLVQAWKKNLPEKVKFTYSPAPWGEVRELHARAYYTAQALNMLDPMHEVLFRTLVLEHKPLNSEDDIAALFVANGADEKKFREAFNGFSVTTQVRQADARSRGAMVSGTPEMVVAGKYRVSASMSGSQETMLEVARFLIDQELARLPKAE